MKHWQLSGSTALVLLLTAPAALAVTPEEVWDNWQKLVAASGELTAGATQRNGDTLEVTGLTFTAKNVEEGTTFSTTLDRLAFRDRGDGSVEITLPETYPFTVTGAEADAPASFTVKTVGTGLSIVASGTAEATNYDYAATEYAVTADSFKTADGKAIDLVVKAAMKELAAKYAVTPGAAGTAIESSGSVASTVVDVVAKDAEKGTDVTASVTVGASTGTSKAVLVDQALMANMSNALKAGFMVDGGSTVGPVTIKVNATEAGKPTAFDATLGGANFKVALDSQRVDYGFGMTDVAASLSSPDVPVPDASAAFGELAFGVKLPVAMTDTPQDFTALFKLADLTAADGLWALFDPGAQLKRDPATLILDLKGQGRWTADIMDPAVQEQAAPPLELASLDLSEVLFKALGGEINATGGLTFDNTDLATYGGVPAPTGKIVANLKGINALIDTAVSMGLVPEDEVMGIRMGLAMFAKPGAGPDELVSEIEFKDKHLFVNGQQLQ
ncbi:DUF2125 domain-containing protein [Pseudogemmobacter blasticus]|uniref:DUF2125 domain-containing protein n=1 Tax=Fuscovulum blasticum DSM 2131 TaxID=1188250 RepID=A0A2T4JBF3_FUSBL|nr:DUF2125 domain-containing protein [Fuscovulum blasticum]PTE15236.1 hypothetical protein C5F44_05325 [Fuscovulum blasticum DSM 2131]